MGNEHSQPAGLDISEKAVEVTDFWTLHSAVISAESETPVSVFVGEPLVSGSLWVNQSPLEKITKALMIYRHPCIIKYVSSWNKGSKLFLAVENIKPLSSILASLSTLQICIGLHSVLKALVFLHENANISHNNVNAASIYVSNDGQWKLGGMEFFARYSEMSEQYMEKTRNLRYDKSIDPNENKIVYGTKSRKDMIDIFAFGVLVVELLRNKTDDEVPGLTLFRELCKADLQHTDVSKRPKFSTLLDHQFFTHDFIKIYAFLTELPLKSESQKSDFFSNLAEKLRNYSENVVAAQLGGLLLSRIVLLNATAQNQFLPFVFCPKEENDSSSSSLFSAAVFQQYLVPKLLQIFCVRDAQIRLLLLTHFKMYMHCFTKDQLQQNILPELLVGIKDTNDHLVSVTLHTLADLVPVLGSVIVIGGKRAKLFNDGRPNSNRAPSTNAATLQLRNGRRNSRTAHTTVANSSASGNPGSSAPTTVPVDLTNPRLDVNLIIDPSMMVLPERPSPDGGEDETSTEELEITAEEELENWSDWDNTESYVTNRIASSDIMNEIGLIGSTSGAIINEKENNASNVTNEPATEILSTNLSAGLNSGKSNSSAARQQIRDITELDIKNQKNVNVHDDFDFFQDMEPVIETANVFLINGDVEKDDINGTIINNSEELGNGDNIGKHLSMDLKFDENESIPVDGWGDDLDWTENN